MVSNSLAFSYTSADFRMTVRGILHAVLHTPVLHACNSLEIVDWKTQLSSDNKGYETTRPMWSIGILRNSREMPPEVKRPRVVDLIALWWVAGEASCLGVNDDVGAVNEGLLGPISDAHVARYVFTPSVACIIRPLDHAVSAGNSLREFHSPSEDFGLLALLWDDETNLVRAFELQRILIETLLSDDLLRVVMWTEFNHHVSFMIGS